MMQVKTLRDTFLPKHRPERENPPDAQTVERWRRRYRAALDQFRNAGIQTVHDEEAGAQRYVSLRAEWDCYISALAPAGAYAMEEIDRAGSNPDLRENREQPETSPV